MIEIKPMAPALGAEIHGLDLREPLEAAQIEAVRCALDEHLVVFFPDQKLDTAAHVALGESFGALTRKHPPYLKTLPDHPEIVVLEGQAGGKADLWHTDITWFERPPAGSILHALAIPEHGGDTMWANLQAAYAGLSSRLKAMLDDAVAVHDLTLTIGAVMRERSISLENPAGKNTVMPTDLPHAEHPVVRTHPRTGKKGLFVNPTFTSHIKDMPLKESDAILGFLYEHCVQPEYTVRKRWSQGDVGFWDNRCTMHYALADYGAFNRVIQRVTIEGEKPV